MRRLILASIAASLLAVSLGSAVAAGGILTVGPGGYGSIGAAVQAAAAGDKIVVQTGVYYEQVTLKSGITIEPAPGAAVAVDGSEPSLISGGWQNYSGETYYATVSWPVYYVAQDDLRLFRHSSVAALARGGYFNDTGAGRVYVRLSDGSGPSLHQMHVSRRDSTFVFNGADNVTIRGIEHRYCNESCLELTGGADNNVIENDTVHGAKFLIDVGGGSTSNIIRNNNLYETGYKASGWSWDSVKGSQQEGAAIYFDSSAGSATVENNTITSGFDGIGAHGGTNVLISGNNISGCVDDGLEMDIGQGSNFRVFGNRVSDCLVGISASPVATGPLYVYRNQFINISSSVFKLGWDDVTDVGAKYFYHNSAYSTVAGSNGITYYGGHIGSNITFRNNAIFAQRYAAEKRYATLVMSIDYDNLEQTPQSQYVNWDGDVEYSNLAALQAATNQEMHGISQPQGFASAPSDLQLTSTSPNINAGVVLPGFNDGFCGAAPDIGAFEFCPVIPPPSLPPPVLKSVPNPSPRPPVNTSGPEHAGGAEASTSSLHGPPAPPKPPTVPTETDTMATRSSLPVPRHLPTETRDWWVLPLLVGVAAAVRLFRPAGRFRHRVAGI